MGSVKAIKYFPCNGDMTLEMLDGCRISCGCGMARCIYVMLDFRHFQRLNEGFYCFSDESEAIEINDLSLELSSITAPIAKNLLFCRIYLLTPCVLTLWTCFECRALVTVVYSPFVGAATRVGAAEVFSDLGKSQIVVSLLASFWGFGAGGASVSYFSVGILSVTGACLTELEGDPVPGFLSSFERNLREKYGATRAAAP